MTGFSKSVLARLRARMLDTPVDIATSRQFRTIDRDFAYEFAVTASGTAFLGVQLIGSRERVIPKIGICPIGCDTRAIRETSRYCPYEPVPSGGVYFPVSFFWERSSRCWETPAVLEDAEPGGPFWPPARFSFALRNCEEYISANRRDFPDVLHQSDKLLLPLIDHMCRVITECVPPLRRVVRINRWRDCTS
jgi:hypothetical protein